MLLGTCQVALVVEQRRQVVVRLRVGRPKLECLTILLLRPIRVLSILQQDCVVVVRLRVVRPEP